MRAPSTVGRGLAEVTLRFDAWADGNVSPSRHKVEVVRPKIPLQLEEVSSRLKRSLMHPNRDAVMAGIRFSRDGRRLIAGDYPGGVIQLWDVATGDQLTKIETGYGYRSTDDYFFPSPDWKTVYVSLEKRKPTRIEVNGKQRYRWEFEGMVRAWDLDSGAVRDSFQQTPMRGIRWMTLSPDGSRCFLGEELPGEAEGSPARAASLLDLETREFRQLPGPLSVIATFSPDGKAIAIEEHVDDHDSSAAAVRIFDAATGSLIRSLPFPQKFTQVDWMKFSPDGQFVVTSHRILPGKEVWKDWTYHLTFWDLNSGTKAGSHDFDDKGSGFSGVVFSPDGRTLAATNWRGSKCRLFLFDVATKRLAHAVTLDDKALARQPVFSPDGRWVAVATQVFPDELSGDRDPSPLDVPQPRIHLVEAATGLVRETIVGPQAFTASVSFSPDGKTLAAGGLGRVLLWDVEQIANR